MVTLSLTFYLFHDNISPMETPQNQTSEIIAKSWADLEAEGERPVNFIGTPYLDESTVPAEKRGIYETVVAAEHSAIEAEVEAAKTAEAEASQLEREHFLATREQARKDLSDIAVRGSIAASINERPATPAAIGMGTYHDGYMTKSEARDFLEARRNGTPQ